MPSPGERRARARAASATGSPGSGPAPSPSPLLPRRCGSEQRRSSGTRLRRAGSRARYGRRQPRSPPRRPSSRMTTGSRVGPVDRVVPARGPAVPGCPTAVTALAVGALGLWRAHFARDGRRLPSSAERCRPSPHQRRRLRQPRELGQTQWRCGVSRSGIGGLLDRRNLGVVRRPPVPELAAIDRRAPAAAEVGYVRRRYRARGWCPGQCVQLKRRRQCSLLRDHRFACQHWSCDPQVPPLRDRPLHQPHACRMPS